jgi:cytochrome c-type biogenesis protein CcmH/NrfG
MNEDINQEILQELRRLRRSSQWSVYLCLLAFCVLAAYFVLFRPQLVRSRFAHDLDAYQRAQQPPADSSDAWTGIQAALDRGDNQRALSLAKSFVARQPAYHYSHATLGSVYVAMNDFTNAEAAYTRAVDLYPVEEHEKALGAIRKRLARERGAQAQVR